MSARGRAESAAGLPLGGGEQRKGMVMDTGMAHKRGTSERVMYRGPDLPFGNVPLGETPMAVWPASGGQASHMTLDEFNRDYIVDHRFDTSRVPSDRER